MIGLMKNYNSKEAKQKDIAVQAFIKEINPYKAKPSLGIDLRALSKYVKDTNQSVSALSPERINSFSLKNNKDHH